MTDRPALPSRMAKLPRDPRGYPIPVIVLIDQDGRPHFQINDDVIVQRCLRDRLCSICGERLTRGTWFIGGAMSAFDPHGAYIDGPVHGECARYALQVCPYLAAPNYARRLDGKTNPRVPDHVVTLDRTVLEGRPTIFVAVMSRGFDLGRGDWQPVYRPRRPYMRVEYWRHGQQLDPAAAIDQLHDQGDWHEPDGFERPAEYRMDPVNLPPRRGR
jgi:hypothetical protein